MVGETINTILKGNSALQSLVSTRIFPYVMNEDTPSPAVVYAIESLEPEYNKGSWAKDDISFSVISVSTSYTELQSVVSAVRTALELSSAEGINRIYLNGMSEGYDHQAESFYNKLNFKVVVNKY
jgi:hypothetical protein